MKLGWAEPVAAAIGPRLMRALAATWRFRERGLQHWRPLRDGHKPFIFAAWHSRLLPLLALHKGEGVVLLISRHRDGGYLADLAQQWGFHSVRGSTQRGGEVGLLGVVRALQAGAVVAITPDGPRGPAERVQPGVVAAAQHAGVPIVAVGAIPSSAWYLHSWDRMCIPKPLSAIEVAYSRPIDIAAGKEGLRHGIDDVSRGLREVMTPP